MTNLKSTTALFMLLLVPCKAFGGLSDVASSIVELPMNMVKSAANLTMELVDGVAGIEETTFHAITGYPVEGARKVVALANEHSQTLWRLASVATLAYAFRYAKDAYVNKCPMASCTKLA